MLESSLRNLTEQMPLALCAPEAADEIRNGWKKCVPVSSWPLTEPETILVNTVRRMDQSGPDGSAQGFELGYRSGGSNHAMTSVLGVRSAAADCSSGD
ncbi:hypothetical protein [Paeniglutamicibacter cryotolerans]|uniref:hypothetical protein n=1 Tax=Paeniglutamicibacter cryotolerans TaxID=670079 RepID=UPI001607D024